MPFTSMIVNRLAQAIGVMLVVAFVAFLLSNFVGDPVSNLVGQEASLEDRERLREELGLNDPLPVQFIRFVGNALQGDFGTSYRFQRPVSDLIAERLPATLELVFVSALFAVLLGVASGVFTAINRENFATQVLKGAGPEVRPLARSSIAVQAGMIALIAGIVMLLAGAMPQALLALGIFAACFVLAYLVSGRALRQAGLPLSGLQFVGGIARAFLARGVMTLSLVGVSLPTFVIGILLIYLFAVEWRLLPSNGRGEVIDLGWWTSGLLTHEGRMAIILPAITLGLYQLTLILRLVRSEMLEVMRTDYIKFARARGLSNSAINYGHALKNTLLPVTTIIGLQIGGLIAFSIITETVFQWPGMGLLFIGAVQVADVPIMSAYLVLVSLVFVVTNLAVDIAYFLIDPRLRTERTAKA